MPDYKLYIFVNTLYLSDAERECIKRKLQKNHATALFLYGSGVINPDRAPAFSPDHIADLTGITCKQEDGIYSGIFRIKGENFLTRVLPDDEFYGKYPSSMVYNASGHFGKIRELTPTIFPLLYPNDKSAELLGAYADSELPAFVRKEADGFTSYLCGVKALTADIVREVAREAGCHIYDEEGDVLYANRRFITHHASHGGEKVIRLPRAARITDAYDDTVIAEQSDTITFRSRLGDTRTFRVEYNN